jgi:hypothetical protein
VNVDGVSNAERIDLFFHGRLFNQLEQSLAHDLQ